MLRAYSIFYCRDIPLLFVDLVQQQTCPVLFFFVGWAVYERRLLVAEGGRGIHILCICVHSRTQLHRVHLLKLTVGLARPLSNARRRNRYGRMNGGWDLAAVVQVLDEDHVILTYMIHGAAFGIIRLQITKVLQASRFIVSVGWLIA